jgi:type II secretory ATPase GspE/PulE/Tfp pilus assembly ATPase PilB-like protein
MRVLGALTPSTRNATVSTAIVEPLLGARSLEIAGVSWRVSSAPVFGGTHVRMHRPVVRTLDQLGLAELTAQLERPGLVAIAGPIGSGRTTTLYAALTSLDLATHTVITIEDAIERPLPGVLQMLAPKRPEDPYAFAHVVCDQGPEVVGIGHLSDAFMAALAVSCTHAGASVLATVDAQRAAAIPAKLLMLGIEPFQIVTSLRFVIAQRLVRASCQHCLAPDRDGAAKLAELGHPGITPHRPRGCERCSGTRYAGRIALFEAFPFAESIRELVLMGASEAELHIEAVRLGMIDLEQRALAAIRDGRCTVDDAALAR